MQSRLLWVACALVAGSAHAYTNAEDAVRAFNTCKGFEMQTAALWKARQEQGTQPPATAGKASAALRPINAKMDEVLASKLSAYAHPEDAGREVFSYCQSNLERLNQGTRAQ